MLRSLTTVGSVRTQSQGSVASLDLRQTAQQPVTDINNIYKFYQDVYM